MSNFSFVPRATALAAATFALSLSASAPAIAGPAVPSATPYPAPGCGGGTLATYQVAGGAQGCTVGAVTFYDFSQAFQYGSTVSPAGAIVVTPGADPSAPSLTFGSTLFDRSASRSAADYYFEYYIDPPIDILGFRLADAPFVNSYVEASVCVGATFNSSLMGGNLPNYGGGEGAPTFTGGEGFTPQDSCSFAAPGQVAEFLPQYYYFNINGTSTPVDQQIFAQGNPFADVLVHVHIGAGGLIDDFSTGVLLAPEPGEWALAGLGGLVMAGALRRRRRRAPAGTA